MSGVSIEAAVETYKRTVKNEPRTTWALWVITVSNSIAAGEWLGKEHTPGYAFEVYQIISAQNEISFSDSN